MGQRSCSMCSVQFEIGQHEVLFLDLEPQTFTIIYALFFLALLLSLIFVRPRLPQWLRRRRREFPTISDG